jgi:hypothetical protein
MISNYSGFLFIIYIYIYRLKYKGFQFKKITKEIIIIFNRHSYYNYHIITYNLHLSMIMRILINFCC